MNLLRRIQSIFLNKDKQKQAMEQLQWQSYLLQSGIPARAEVLELSVKDSVLHDYLVVYMWLNFKYQDRVIYQQVGTQINRKMLPKKNQLIHIKFLPENISQVLVL